jgi:hypothetical protein
MSTWIPRTFGGDRIIQPPTAFNIQGYLKPNTTFNSSSFMPSALARPVPPTATQVCTCVLFSIMSVGMTPAIQQWH